tara:strand:- start:1705 stop:2508 length:804 start_codon:yes stop_codon:yes gene_type:complete
MDINLKNYSVVAHNILNSQTQYQSNKAIISALFNNKPINAFESIVKNRITIIDSYYSTQMSKRLYGIDELANTLAKYPDDVLKTETIKFLNNPSEDCIINSLFVKEYGVDKSGKPFGKATSLISKYLYFLNSYKFPIYDSLAFISYSLLQNNNTIVNKAKVNERNYFELINQLNIESKINNYEKLDNLLWLIGKLSKGSFAILMDMNKYLELIDSKEIKTELIKTGNKKSSAKDEIIRDYIKKHYKTSSLFSEEQKTFFEFVFSLQQ